MRPYRTLIVSVLLTVSFHYSSQAQTTYTINPSNTWTAKVGSTTWCGTCTFNISPGQTLNLNYAATCGTCTFNGGNIIVSADFACQGCTFNNDTITLVSDTLNLQSSTNTFNKTILTTSGTKTSSVKSTGGVAINNSKFTFNDSSYFYNNGGQYNSSNSILTFDSAGYFESTSGPVNLTNASELVAGNGTLASSAYIYMNMGGGLNLDANSTIKLSNYNNYYFNWSAYNSTSNSKTYTTTSSTLNCGGSYPHACSTSPTGASSAAYMYGCATMNSSGASPCTPLAVEQVNLTADLSGSNAVQLSWSVSQNFNADHFTVQRSGDNQNWTTIGSVAAKGYGAPDPDYTFIDPSPLSGTNIYRLLIVDIDGGVTYSKAVPIQFSATPDAISIYPNPVTGQTFHLKVGSLNTVMVSVYTQTGQLLFLTSLSGQTQYEVHLPANVPHNNYLVIQVISHDKTHAFELFND